MTVFAVAMAREYDSAVFGPMSKIASPGGGSIDVRAELPDHFRQSLETLGFDLAAGENSPAARPARPRPDKPKKPTRRGERRSRQGVKRR